MLASPVTDGNKHLLLFLPVLFVIFTDGWGDADDLGIGVLENAWQGYNVSLFAYGQTGAGKSYSMVGYGADKGIIPCACHELFCRIESSEDPDMTYHVQASMMEIYHEKVRDLFNPAIKQIMAQASKFATTPRQVRGRCSARAPTGHPPSPPTRESAPVTVPPPRSAFAAFCN